MVGACGVALIVGSYAAVQLGRLEARSTRNSGANALGAALVLVSLAVDFNLSAALIEGFWLVISVVGLLRVRRARDREETS